MTATQELPEAEPFDLSAQTVGLERQTGKVLLMVPQRGGPPRIDGYTVGAPLITRDPPHNGEMHPDADELLYLISGSIKVVLELPGGNKTVDVAPGQALVVPRGVWHLVRMQKPSQLIHITPGPGGDHRPLQSAG